MTQPAPAPARTLRLIVLALFGGQLVACAAMLLLVWLGPALAFPIPVVHAIAYAWVAVTVVAAVAAYLLAIRGVARGERVSLGRALVAVALADVAAFAGIVGFYLARVWPMLAVAGLCALLGLAVGMPLARAFAQAPADADPAAGAPGEAGEAVDTVGSA